MHNVEFRRTDAKPKRALARLFLLAVVTASCGAPSPGQEVLIRIQDGATFREVVDTLESRGIVEQPLRFRAYARWKGLDRSVRAGTYRLAERAPFSEVLRDLTEGRVETYPVTIPEGLTLPAIASRLTAAVDADSATILTALSGDSLHLAWDVPGPGLEGYLFPDTYRFAEGVTVDQVVSAMVGQYRDYWTPARRHRMAELGMTEREVVSLAAIVQAEARRVEEMPTIASVYHNRLDINMRLQADPTVLYALGGTRARLLYAAIDSVQDHPYNTYSQYGLPPGAICAPGESALDTALNPIESDFLYFVARNDGTHIFTRSLREHNRARIRVRQEAASGG
ncbi:MAG: endolytic transglycosylase MltG [Longimicrobiales bacterium]